MKFDKEKIIYTYMIPALALLAPIAYVFGLYAPIQKNLTLDLYSLKCKTLSWDQKGNKIKCHDFDMVYEGTQKFLDVKNSKNQEMFEFINEHCFSFDDKKRCKSIVTNFTALEVKNIYSGSKKIDTDFVGNLSAM